MNGNDNGTFQGKGNLKFHGLQKCCIIYILYNDKVTKRWDISHLLVNKHLIFNLCNIITCDNDMSTHDRWSFRIFIP